jgi:DNA ligase-1
MKTLKQIVNELQGTNGKLEKQTIIKENLNNKEFIEVMKFILDDFIVTGLSSKKINKDIGILDIASPHKVNSIEEAMNYLIRNKTGSDYNIAVMQLFINESPEELQEIYKQIVTKSLKLGVSADTWNKCASKEDQIPVFDVMLAKKYDEHKHKVKGDFIITNKLDGMRCVYINGQFFSRQGQLIDGLDDIIEEMKECEQGYVYDGELLLRNDQGLHSKDLYRETIKVSRKDGKKENLEFHIFDMIKMDGFKAGIDKTKCIDRKVTLSREIHEFKWLKEVPILYCGKDKTIIKSLLEQAIANEQEGLMLNVADASYELKRSDKILKIKVMQSVDLKILGVEKGEGKYSETLGKINVDYKGYFVGVGSGFSDEERNEIWTNPDKYIGKIGEIQYFEESSNQDGGISIRFPVWKGLREDKTEPSYE